MPLNEREESVLTGIQEWENKLLNYEPNDLEMVYDKSLERSFSLLPEEVQQQFFSAMDSWLFHLHALIQGSQLQMDAKERILTAGRVFHSDIETIEDLKQLTIDQLQYIAQQQIARHRLYSFAQGGIAGSGSSLMLGTDIPAMAVINLRAVQLIAMTYGFEVNTPFEMMSSLKVFHAATLPPRMQGSAWEELKNELKNQEEFYFYEGKEELTDITWVEQPMKQLFKAMAIYFFRRKSVQGIPFISMAIGAGTNYQLTRKVTDFAHKYYQMRYLHRKNNQQ
ncbi:MULTISPECIES: EcsC family protein [Cytobacillus]|jgi:EcsC protein family|uniref:ABC transporter substrate-binding protein n=3 Tax=Cytobacillus TaxID=2675230 RepID=A0A160MF63_9BACI|nr:MULTISPECIES: EcsC family protein [Cytobacillus]EFV77210.1 EcsC protein [Bacillus sp. 2_A_57_CT2]MBY0158990.1 EcsC family protein [Cytobacillus firmus]AND41780.1 ABC transporter substrate-binding protein [Cytobacillus oceanisediminis 2691]MBU8730546.1 EcsC family protein [Cytobacillus oceanisediminis]MBU8770086.1 EcsC family protein [Cytobacillus oceanisediminis]